ncbi:FtsX-like permease family protein [Lutimaribacter marinistellae]|uniref:FtsX-like permease family protein n=1 Tax=Lutimaribacter marinistellae TaxID=1820329 RepID=A0ABV7TPN7_9RHOB
MTGAVLAALWSHWRRHPLQLVTLLVGLALATGLWSAVQAINAEARASYARAEAQMGGGSFAELHGQGREIPLETYVALRRSGWLVSPVLEGPLRHGGRVFTVMGVDFLTHPPLPAIAESGAEIAPLDALGAPGRVFARPGDAAHLAGLDAMPPLIESDAVPPGLLLTDIGAAERLLNRGGEISRLVVLPGQPLNRPPLEEIAPELQLVEPEAQADAARLTDSFHLNLTAFGFLSFAVGLFIVHGTVGLALEQRRGMVRTLRALGAPLSTITRLVAAELLALALVGGLAGLVLGYLLAGLLLPDVSATLRGLYGAPVDGRLSLRPGWVLSGLAMAVVGTLAASGASLGRLARMPLLAGAGSRAWSLRPRGWQAMAAGGMALIAVGISAVLLFDGLTAGFVFLGGLLMGGALLLPPALALILRLAAARARGPVAQWVWADMRAQLPGISLALMALLLALAANIGVGTMVSSFRLTFVGWLDQRLVSEVYVTARDDAQGAEVAEWLQTRADAVLPIRSTEIRYEGAPLFVYGIVDHPTYSENWPLLDAVPGVWARVAGGDGLLINEQLARREGLGPGDAITLAPDWQMQVVGVYSDYGNPTGQAITSLDRLLAQAEAVPNQQFGVRIAPDQATALVQELRATFDLPPRGVVQQAGVKAQSLAIFDNTFVVTGALNVLTLGVAGFAILTSLLTLWTQRLPQIAPVWALGLTRARLARLELIRSAALAAMTAVLALPLGLVLAWALLAVINVEAFGWRLPMHLFPLDWLRLFALAILAALVAAALPARKLNRLPPAQMLRVFANER